MPLADWFLSDEDRENIRRGDEAEAKLRQMNERNALSGKYDPGTYATILDHFDNPGGGRVNSDNADQLVEDAFEEGFYDGYTIVTGTIKKGLNAPFKFAFDAIPGWFWIVGIGAAFFYMGGSVKGVLKK